MTYNRDRNELSYLHFIHYANEKLTAKKGGSDEWVGRVRLLMNELKDVKGTSKAVQIQLNQMSAEQDKIKNLMSEAQKDQKIAIREAVT